MAWDGSMFGYAPGVNYNAQPAPAATPPAQPAPPQQASLPQPSGSGGMVPPSQLARWMQMLMGSGNGSGGGNNPAAGGQLAYGGGGQQQGAAAGGQAASSGTGGLWGSINQNGGYSGINLGPWGAGALQALAAGVPGYGGLALSAIQAALRGANTYTADQNNRALGAGGLDFGQILGSVLGLNNYGSLSGNQTYVNRDGLPGRLGVAVTQGGMYDNGFLGGGPFGIFSDPRTADTFQESVDRHNITKAIAALLGNGGGNSGFGSNNVSNAQQVAAARSGHDVISQDDLNRGNAGGAQSADRGGGIGSGNGGTGTNSVTGMRGGGV